MSNVAHESAAVHTEGLLGPFAYGRGFLEPETPANPSVGANFTKTVDGRYVSRLVAVTFTLTTSAVAANRIVSVDILDGNGKTLSSRGPAVQILANSTQKLAADVNRGGDDWITGGTIFFGLNSYYLEPGRQVQITVVAIDAGDQLSNIVLSWERFPTGPRGYPEGAVGHDRRHAQQHRPSHHVRRP